MRIFVKGKLPAGGRKKGNIEIYSTGRYLTVTGHAVRNRISRVIELRQAEIDTFLLEHFPDPKSKPNHSRNGNGAWHPSDEELLEKAFAAKNGDKLKNLFRGDVGSYPSQSEADFALCSLLAFWAQDTAQLDRFYRRSSLYRDKWDQKHGAMTYGEMTIEKAFASCAEHYSRNGNGHAENEGETHQPLIITMDQIKAEKVDWLWDNRIPIGRLTLLDGDPGSGKSFLSLEIASRVSKGEALPFGGKKRSPANVLLMSCEDGYNDTVRPRLDRLGADVSRIAIPNPQKGLSTTLLNASFIEQAVKELGPLLVVIDPIVAFAGGKNTDKANEVRALLSPLMSIAERYALACLVVRHFTKQVDAKAMYRGGGSVDFMAACRCAFIIVESKEEPNTRVLAR